MPDTHQAHVLRRDLERVAYALSGPPPDDAYRLALLNRQQRWQSELEVLENGRNGRTAAAADQAPKEDNQGEDGSLRQRPPGEEMDGAAQAVAREQLAPRELAVYEHIRGNGGVAVSDITGLGWTEQMACRIARQLVACGLVRPVRDDGMVHYGTVLVV